MPDFSAQLSRLLFAAKNERVYVVLDGANVPDLLPKLHEHRPEHECLYRGELAPDIAEVAPYLALLEPSHPFTGWLLAQGWGNNWGVFATGTGDLRTLRRHFRTFLIVHDEAGKPLYFRYYDPRVLRTYLPTCAAGELATVFGAVTNYFVESDDGRALLRFVNDNGALRRERLDVAGQT